MKKLLLNTILIIHLIFCNSILINGQSLKLDQLKTREKTSVLTCIYSKKGIDVKVMGMGMVLGGAIGGAITSSEIKKNSKDADTTSLNGINIKEIFTSRFTALKDSLKYFNFIITKNAEDKINIVNKVATKNNKNLNPGFNKVLGLNGTMHVCAIKFQYGISMRGNSENFGFVKTYRPYVLVKSVIKDLTTNKNVWGNTITLFSNRIAYKGKGEIEKADIAALTEEYKILCNRASEILIQDMDGKRYESKDLLVAPDGSDNTF